MVVSLRDTPHVDRVSGRADIAQLLSLFVPFHFEVAETEQAVEGERLLIRAHGTVRSTATQMAAPTALTAALNAAVASMAGHFVTHFTRQIACSLHGDTQNVFPILLDELQLG